LLSSARSRPVSRDARRPSCLHPLRSINAARASRCRQGDRLRQPACARMAPLLVEDFKGAAARRQRRGHLRTTVTWRFSRVLFCAEAALLSCARSRPVSRDARRPSCLYPFRSINAVCVRSLAAGGATVSGSGRARAWRRHWSKIAKGAAARAGMRTAAACGLMLRRRHARAGTRERPDADRGARARYAAFFSRSCFHWPRAARLFIMARWTKARCAAATFSLLPDHACCGACCSARP